MHLTCAITVGPSHHLLQNLRPDVLHVLSDLNPSGLDHEHVLIHCGQKGKGQCLAMLFLDKL